MSYNCEEKCDNIVDYDINEINDIETKMLEYEKYFSESENKSNNNLLKAIDIVFSSWDNLHRRSNPQFDDNYSIETRKLEKLFIKLIFYDKLSTNTIKFILEKYYPSMYHFLEHDIRFVKYYINIDIIKQIISYDFRGDYDDDMYIHACLSITILDYIDDILLNIQNYTKDMINDKIEEFEKIIVNLNILNHNADIYHIADYSCKQL